MTIVKISVAAAVAILAILVGNYFLGGGKTSTKTPSELNPQYDYVIIGGGTAGSVLAARLSEDPSVSVLVLEAGTEETELFYTHIPGAVPFLQGTSLDWQYFTVPQTHCCDGLVDNQARWPRGKCLGGTSVLNYMHYVRGHPADYDDHWVAASGGDEGWDYNHMVQYFKKSESIQIDHLRTSEYHGLDGPIAVSRSVETEMGFLFLDALRQKGYKIWDDTSGAVFEGFSRVQSTTSKGKRASAAAAYLRPAMNARSNLHVVTNAHVTKVTFNYNDLEKRAVSAEYMHGGARHRVLANREIILSAGSIGSPQLLMLSGIGEAEQLKPLGIIPVHELPAVGKNLRDHVVAYTLLAFNESIGLDADKITSPFGLVKATLEYFLFGSGPLSNAGMELTGFLRSGLIENDPRPDVQLYMFPMNPLYEDLYKLGNLKYEVSEALQGPLRGKPTGLVGSVVLHPQNTGEIRLQSSDPFVPPLIDPKYFQNDVDWRVLLHGLKLMIDAALSSKSLQRYGVSLAEAHMPRCENVTLYSDDYWTCVIRNRLLTLYHPVGTCRMGVSPEDSVVDGQLRVHGVKGLRIVDASVFPDQISGNPYAPTVALAEKAADMIKLSARP